MRQLRTGLRRHVDLKGSAPPAPPPLASVTRRERPVKAVGSTIILGGPDSADGLGNRGESTRARLAIHRRVQSCRHRSGPQQATTPHHGANRCRPERRPPWRIAAKDGPPRASTSPAAFDGATTRRTDGPVNCRTAT